ncbi:lipoprotein [Pseudomonas amygdali pv. tabaci str. 6605]|nr:lipoprotein [Pseudomonas amygdali pv. tabaci str. 6605]KEZ66537.1 lipoprotein [Pseudomonas amygdali pv. tabaci str. ATCC 11528]
MHCPLAQTQHFGELFSRQPGSGIANDLLGFQKQRISTIYKTAGCINQLRQ